MIKFQFVLHFLLSVALNILVHSGISIIAATYYGYKGDILEWCAYPVLFAVVLIQIFQTVTGTATISGYRVLQDIISGVVGMP